MGAKQPERDVGEPLFLTYREAAKKIGVSERQVYVLLHRGELHSIPFGPQVKRIAMSECLEVAARMLAEAKQIGEAS